MIRIDIEVNRLARQLIPLLLPGDHKNPTQPDLGCHAFRNHEGLARMAEAGVDLNGSDSQFKIDTEDEALVPSSVV
jgi:hypothetical protein